MRVIPRSVSDGVGGVAPAMGALRPVRWIGVALLCAMTIACGDDDETRTLQPIQVGMTSDLGASYDDGELTLYEVKLPVPFPIRAPSNAEQNALNGSPVAPFPWKPWVLSEDVQIQITWTLSNLDPDPHAAEILIDPWFEFGRYYPGLALVDADDGEFLPNLSGIDILYEVPGTASGKSSRLRGTFTFQDMQELAIDFATVMNVIATAPPPDPNNPGSGLGTSTLANHAFERRNLSHKDLLVAKYIPGTIPGLTGVDIGIRTTEPANIALEVVVEVVDKGNDKVLERDSDDPALPEPTQIITTGYGG